MSDASNLANTLATSLLAGTDFSVTLPDFSGDEFTIPEDDPNSPLYGAITRLGNADLTDCANSLTGDGAFDVLMQGFKAHLRAEYEGNRISGAEYTKAYIACTEAAMANGTQFLMNRDSTYWQAVNAQLQAQIAKNASPAYHLTKETGVPTILFHGGEDPLVHVSQAENLYKKLVSLGVPAQFERYPHDKHGMGPASAVDVFSKMIVWLEKYYPAK